MTDLIVPPQINFSRYSKTTPKYNYLKVQIDNQASANVNLTATTNPRIDFKLPSSVINLAKSYLSFTISSVPASGTANVLTVLQEDAVAILENVQVGFGANADLMNITSAANWTKVWNPLAHDMDQFLRNNTDSYFHKAQDSKLFAAVALSGATAPVSLLPSGSLSQNIPASNTSAGAGPGNCYGYQYTKDANDYTRVITVSGAQASINPIGPNEPQHLIVGKNNATTGPIHKRVPLHQLGGFLSTDKDIFTQNDMYIRLTLSNIAKLGHRENLDTGAKTAIAGTVYLTNFYLFVAVEANNDIANAVLEQYRNGGIKFQIDQVVPFFTTLPASSSVNQQYTINRSFGKYLKFALTSFFGANELTGAGEEYDNQNVNGDKIVWYRTSVNGSYLQPENIYCYDPTNTNLNGDELLVCDWVRDSLTNSVYEYDASYMANFTIIDNFAHCVDMPELGIKKSDVGCGLDLDNLNNSNLVYQIQLNTDATAYRAYTYFVFSRECIISPSGITLE